MKKGIIMEMDDTFLILLTPEGEFLRAERTNQAFQIGEEITFLPFESTKSSQSLMKKFVKIKPLWVVSAAAALILIISSLMPMYQDNKAYAYMSIDVNPSIELGVNQHMQVVELKGFNKDGEKIVSALENWKKRDVSDLTETILTEMKKEGFLDQNEPVIISAVYAEKAKKEAKKKLNQNIEEIKQTASNQNLAVKVYSGTKDEMEKAHKLGITTGQYQQQRQEASLLQNGVKPILKQEVQKGKNIKPKDKGISVAPQQNNTKNPHEKNGAHIPPGQQKKQAEIKPSENKTPASQGKSGDDKKIPPGQLKKAGENNQPNNKLNENKKQNIKEEKEKNQKNKGLKNNEKKNKEQKKNQDSSKNKSNGNNGSTQKEKHNK